VEPLLRKGEALVVYVVEPSTTYAWVINKDSGQIGYVTLPLDREALERDIATFRAKLVSGETGWTPRPMTPADGSALHKALFAPLQPWLQGVERILLVVDEPLQGLPFAALADGEGHAADWLGKRYAFSILPTVGSLRALRGIASPRPPGLSFVGFGDPMLTATGLPATGLAMRSLYPDTREHAREGRLVDPEMLRGIASLPDTGIELKAVAKLLNASTDALHLGAQATETQVKRLPLDRYRILSFATHGVMAGELSEGIEPGLILTPPEAPSQLDDGYLSASEAAQLTLDADWVLLSACNTAASDGRPDAEGLSGLANAFLYAGARALLVSHWRVSSEATTKLVAETVAAYAKAPHAGKAAALQAAMIATMQDPGYAHPYYWAPFSVIGD
jgi:CHAT domain-containing protein